MRSNRWADTHGLPKYEFVLHPKTTGFVFLADTMRQCEYTHTLLPYRRAENQLVYSLGLDQSLPAWAAWQNAGEFPPSSSFAREVREVFITSPPPSDLFSL